MAAELGMRSSTYFDLERDKTLMSPQQLRDIQAALQMAEAVAGEIRDMIELTREARHPRSGVASLGDELISPEDVEDLKKTLEVLGRLTLDAAVAILRQQVLGRKARS
jgi:hypothetical protein